MCLSIYSRNIHDKHQHLCVICQLTTYLQMVNGDRQVIADARAAAMRAKADGKPLEAVYMSADAANQTAHALPALYPPTHGGDR